MADFTSKWSKGYELTFGERIKGAIKPAGPLKPRLEQAIRQIQVQVAKLDTAAAKLKERDKYIFNKVVSALQRHEQQRAAVYANELAEVRKMTRMVTQAKLALEQIVLRLNTVQELGDIVVTLAPAMGVIKNIKAGIVRVMPEAEGEMNDISSLLSSILVDAGQLGGYSLNFEAANEDAERILQEASLLAEQSMKERFPELPSPSSLETQE